MFLFSFLLFFSSPVLPPFFLGQGITTGNVWFYIFGDLQVGRREHYNTQVLTVAPTLRQKRAWSTVTYPHLYLTYLEVNACRVVLSLLDFGESTDDLF